MATISYKEPTITASKILNVLNAAHLGASVQQSRNHTSKSKSQRDGATVNNNKKLSPFSSHLRRKFYRYFCCCLYRKKQEEKEEEEISFLSRLHLISSVVFFVLLCLLTIIHSSSSPLALSRMVYLPSLFLIHVLTIVCLLYSCYPLVHKVYLAFSYGRLDMNVLMFLATLGSIFSQEWLEALTVVILVQVSSYITGLCMDYVSSILTDAVSTSLSLQDEVLLRDSQTFVKIEDLSLADVVVIRAGETIPTDGVIVNGGGSVDESSLTGESFPHEARTGQKVKGGAIVQAGYMEIEVTAKLQDSLVYQVYEMVESISMSKTPIQAMVDKVAAYYIPIMIGIAVIIAVFLPLFEIYNHPIPSRSSQISDSESKESTSSKKIWHHWFQQSLVILVMACPCALVMAAPIATSLAFAITAKNGLLFKNASTIEVLANTTHLVCDKTGTLTEGRFVVIKELLVGSIKDVDFLYNVAGALELKSSHPLSTAIIMKALGCITDNIESHAVETKLENISNTNNNEDNHNKQPSSEFEVSNYNTFEGYGISGDIFHQAKRKKHRVYIGNKKVYELFDSLNDDDDDDDDDVEEENNSSNKKNASETERKITASLIKTLSYVNGFTKDQARRVNQFERERIGDSILYLIIDGRTEMIIAMTDQIRDSSSKFISVCQQLAIRTILCTGDAESVAQRVGKDILGIEEINASMTPQGKLEKICKMKGIDRGIDRIDQIDRKDVKDNRRLIRNGRNSVQSRDYNYIDVESQQVINVTERERERKEQNNMNKKKNEKKKKEIVVMLGDGVNDGPALTAADIGIAVGGADGTALAISCADILLLTNNLLRITEGIQFSKFVKQIILSNIVFSIGIKLLILLLLVFNVIAFPLWIAVLVDGLSLLLVVLNSLRVFYQGRNYFLSQETRLPVSM